MMGGDDCSKLNVSESFSGLKLRPLIPKPTSVIAGNTAISGIFSLPYRNFTHYTNVSSLNHHPVHVPEQSRTNFNSQPLPSSRWNPTSEQLLALEELYRRGTRSPTAEQIQQIAAYLRRFGRIEGKNVFYWFQNHKARERQKRRREMASHLPERRQDTSLANNESATRKTGYEVKQAKKWTRPLNCSTHMEESAQTHRSAIAEKVTPWSVQFEERKSQERSRRTIVETNSTWRSIERPRSPSIQTLARTSSDTKFLNTRYGKLLLTPDEEGVPNHEDQRREPETLNLFPPHGYDCEDKSVTGKDTEVPVATRDNFSPNQYFEFLPPKN